MNFISGFISSLASSVTLNSPPLYRYPYRNAQEAFRGDWKNVGKDIEAAQQNYEGTRGETSHE
jgi:hypothetical protein